MKRTDLLLIAVILATVALPWTVPTAVDWLAPPAVASTAPMPPEPRPPRLDDCMVVRPAWLPGQDQPTFTAEAVACRWGRRWCWVTPGAGTALVTWCEP